MHSWRTKLHVYSHTFPFQIESMEAYGIIIKHSHANQMHMTNNSNLTFYMHEGVWIMIDHQPFIH